jgi:hypothetical protein
MPVDPVLALRQLLEVTLLSPRRAGRLVPRTARCTCVRSYAGFATGALRTLLLAANP